MGVSYPVLALVSFVLLLTVIASTVLVSIGSVDQVSSAPALRVHAHAFFNPETGETVLRVTVKHERGRPVVLERVEVSSEHGSLIIPRNSFKLLECVEPVTQGDRCVYENTSRGFFHVGGTYSGLVFFNEGSYPVVFTVMYLYLPPSNQRPVNNVTFINILVKPDETVNNLLSNITNWSAHGAFFNLTDDGVVVIDLGNTTTFGGVGFIYRYDLNIELDLIHGAWLATVMKLSGGLPGKWGIGVYFDFKNDQPVEKIVFMGISVDEGNSSYLVIELYERKEKGSSVDLVASTPLLIPIERIINEKFILTAYVKSNQNANKYNITVALYDMNLTTIATVGTTNYYVRLPGTPGKTWSHRASLVVNNTAATYEFLVLAENLERALSTNVRIRGVPEDYIVEVYDASGELLFRAVSTGEDVVLPILYLEAGSVIQVKYPSSVGEVLAYRHVLERSVEAFTIIELTNATVVSNPEFNNNVAIVEATLPVGNDYTNNTGFIAVELINRNTVPTRVRLKLVEDYSTVSNLTLIVMLVDSQGNPLVETYISVSNGRVTETTTSWTTRHLEPGERVYLYLRGYYTAAGSASKLVIYVESSGVDPVTGLTVVTSEYPVVVNLLASS
ncbi:MAG: hypothetical protein QXK07_07475 [Desulfurococcaceae archaeon]